MGVCNAFWESGNHYPPTPHTHTRSAALNLLFVFADISKQKTLNGTILHNKHFYLNCHQLFL